jgi:protein MpaA
MVVAVAACTTTPTPRPPAAGRPVVRTHRALSTAVSVDHRVFGRSVQGRPLIAWYRGPTSAVRRVLVIGAVHGNEAAGVALVRNLLRQPAPTRAELIAVPDLNPDGVALGVRQNAHRVDLNRNFPYRWQRLGRPGDQQYSGSGPLSEPESRALAALVRQVRPTVTVWFHQPVGVVDESGGSVEVEQRFAGLLGEPLQRLTRYPGSAASWENHLISGSSAFVVELPHTVSASLAARAGRALQDLLR